ncbi:histidine kinase [Steroidobacter agaridevorans]|uniref:Histidine kinase n=1 Tax=Steroidobacter agaridevorans TaxID=2695856 RepID=A0A829Y7V4_9GAMM|nr:DUF1801 domain-containing protein [Steroidobacter agaridevorans]GFE79349.1 histidine kinase [Steroidobacter agaridevorans]GFE88354.1 histidine kinase [Steroidobacter agaridevorans]
MIAKAKAKSKKPAAGAKTKSAPKAGDKVVLLSGGNPQIAKGYGDEPVQAYIAAMPGWKSALGKRIDTLVTRHVPKVHKAVKWNSPFYGMEHDLWFLSFHCFNKYVKLTFFRGSSLKPPPPGLSKYPAVRYFDIREDDDLDEAQLTSWIKQAAALPGEKM